MARAPINAKATPDEQDPAREFQARRLVFIRIAGIWSAVLAIALALAILLYYAIGTLKQSHPAAYWALVVAPLVVFGSAALRIHRAYERLFICPRCAHPPQANELGVILFLGWRVAAMNPSTCAVCGAKLA